jgi:hypothetical protein
MTFISPCSIAAISGVAAYFRIARSVMVTARDVNPFRAGRHAA